jgi:hypothetical protein
MTIDEFFYLLTTVNNVAMNMGNPFRILLSIILDIYQKRNCWTSW